jgi:hypothetical protein
MRRACVLGLVLAAMLPGSAVAAPELTYECSPAPQNCLGWYRSAVTLTWDWNQHQASPIAGNCNPRQFVNDTAGTATFCEIEDVNGLTTKHTVVIHVDRTPPKVDAAVPARPPDHGDWFNHPVGFSFQGSDATSGLQSCAPVTYSGPDGAGAQVRGSCRDVAGNAAAAAFPLNYDATPPGAPEARAIPGDGLVRLEWSGTQGADAVEIVRMTPGAPTALYRGAGPDFVDRGLANGTSYRYRLTAIDRAGNTATSEVGATPTSAPLLTPTAGGRLKAPPLLVWRKRKGATYYNVQVFRGGRKILSRWPRTNRLQLHRTWRFRGRKYRLRPGRYVWYVFPGYGKRAARNYGRVLGRRTFVVTR